MRARRAAFAGIVAVCLVVPVLAVAASHVGGGDRTASASPPSFQRDVAPILRTKCTGCHQVGGIAPFPLVTAEQAQNKAALIAYAVGAKIMPPWPPGPASPNFVGQGSRLLTSSQRSTLLRWARAGGKATGAGAGKPPPETLDIRPGERVIDIAMASSYTPSGKNGATDDYRCFLLDPKLGEDAFATSVRIVPKASSVVHHVILFRVDKEAAAEAGQLDDASPGAGWSCFGGTGADSMGMNMRQSLDNASWLAAWAPGWGNGRLPDGVGVPLKKGSLIVMQVHYNLLNGSTPDRSRAVLAVVPASAKLNPISTRLFPAPVELACTKGERGRLCKRSAALADLARKYGPDAALAPLGLLVLCGKNAISPRPSTTTYCDRTFDSAATIRIVAGHMHLLGSSIRLELNPGTPSSRVLLDIPHWDFHWQNAYTLVDPVDVKAGDVLRVTCRYNPSMRRHGHPGIPKTPRYVLWGEGTTDEMCLGLVQATR
jgi:Copper type II ascorbate-dependent monooxygenase, C-terminal domain/Copper type II ascorbate-dependent monooxygenase, N-terminal domain